MHLLIGQSHSQQLFYEGIISASSLAQFVVETPTHRSIP